jgi:hypothetical protein
VNTTGVKIFERAEPPAGQRGLAINQSAIWYTWSTAFRNFTVVFENWLRSLPEPELITIPGLVKYDYTLSLPLPADHPFWDFVRSMCQLERPCGIMLFTDLLDQDIDGFILRRLFAMLRFGIARSLSDERFSLYAPLGTTGAGAGDFDLHADLYLPELLFNVFEEVPGDSSGASIFLHTADLFRLMPQVTALPSEERARITACFQLPPDQDRFKELFRLLHSPSRPWVAELEQEMRKHQLTIKLGPGQGYFIHDRTWLHGRELPNGSVSARRLHRLIFNNAAIYKQVTARLLYSLGQDGPPGISEAVE